ncbi:hypothetical protein [Aliikangiella maris]|uniref:Lipoprotein n=2 Tax=Aliikangiella maris TaxID=3162458 RepID=A0ABV2BSU4_9GAMM
MYRNCSHLDHPFLTRLILVCSACLLLSNCQLKHTQPAPYTSANCPAFVNNQWQVTQSPAVNTQELIDKQKFAVQDSQQTFWFHNDDKQLGLCIPPPRTSKQFVYDCGTIYVIYEQIAHNWQILEQKVTICPG